jgi:hypothetical protein
MVQLGADTASRRKIALDRIDQLIVQYDDRARRAWRNYYYLQALTIGLAALTPCLIFLSTQNPRNTLFEWLQLFFPAIAAIAAGVNSVFRWREDGVRYTSLAEAIRSQLWRFQTRAGEFGGALSDDAALDRLVTRVDELNLQSLARWTAAQAAEAPAATEPKAATAGG